jgi:hypothetical protein
MWMRLKVAYSPKNPNFDREISHEKPVDFGDTLLSDNLISHPAEASRLVQAVTVTSNNQSS